MGATVVSSTPLVMGSTKNSGVGADLQMSSALLSLSASDAQETILNLLLGKNLAVCNDAWVTRYGIRCSTPCATYGQNYYWCRVGGSKWDYCSVTAHYTIHGQYCGNGCEQRGQSYYWCDTAGSGPWDYCSPRCR